MTNSKKPNAPAETLGSRDDRRLVVQWTHIEPIVPHETGKRYFLNADGSLGRDDTPWMTEGVATVWKGRGIDDFVAYLNEQQPGKMTTYGIPIDAAKLDAEGTVAIHSRKQFARLSKEQKAAAITRTLDDIAYPTVHGILMLDHDTPRGQPPMTEEALLSALSDASSPMGQVSVAVGLSSSSKIMNGAIELRGETGRRVYIVVADASDIPRAGAALMKRLWLTRHGRIEISGSGTLLLRTVVDGTVWPACHLDFTGGAICLEPLHQARGRFEVADAIKGGFEVLDTRVALPDLSAEDERRYQRLVEQAKANKAEEAAKIRSAWVEQQLSDAALHGQIDGGKHDKTTAADAIRAIRSGPIGERLRRLAETGDGGRLPGDLVLTVQMPKAGRRGAMTEVRASVLEVLRDPARFDGMPCLDPLEPDYDGRRWVGRIHCYGAPNIHSFAHGGVTYQMGSADEWDEVQTQRSAGLREALATITQQHGAEVLSSPMLSAARALWSAANAGDEAAATDLTQIEKLAADQKKKTEWRKALAHCDETRPSKDEALPESARRPIIVYREEDDESEVIQKIGEAIGAKRLMFNQNGTVVALKPIPQGDGTLSMSVTPATAGDLMKNTSKSARLRVLKRTAKEVPLQLSGPLAQAVLRAPEVFPQLVARVTAPAIAKNGALLSGQLGYDPARRMIIDAPDIEMKTWSNPKAALAFLLDAWLGEVDFKTRRDRLRSLALPGSMLKRLALMNDPGPPMFLFSAPQAGSGKSTLARALIRAGTGGRGASDTPWPETREELVKLLVSKVREGAPALYFDNVPRGWRIGSAALDAFITSSTFGGRVLGVSETMEGSATFPIIMSGNNVVVEGDTTSRAIEIRLEPKWTQQSKKEWTGDIDAFTTENLGRIIGALHAIFTADVGAPPRIEGRFPRWYREVGWPLAALSGDHDLYAFWQDADTSGGLADNEAFQHLLSKMHETAMRECWFGDDGTGWLTGVEMIKHCSIEVQRLADRHSLSAQGLHTLLRKYDGIPVGNLRFQLEKRNLSGRSNWKSRWAFGVELRSGALDSGIDAPSSPNREAVAMKLRSLGATKKTRRIK